MLRVAVIADSHFDEGSRFEECVRLHEWIARDVASRGVDVIVHAGDIFERKSTPAERRAVAEWLGCCADIAPVLIVRGNHDAVGDLAIFARLRTKHPVIVEEACGVHVLENRACPGCGRLQRIEGEGEAGQGGVRRCVDDGAGAGCGREWRRRAVAVGAFAWPRKAELLARLRAQEARARSRQDTDAVAGEALRLVLQMVGEQLAAHNGPRLLLAHAMVRGSATSTGQPLVGCDIELGLEDLGLARADLVAIGHVHKGQDWQWAGAPVVYPGSPRRTAFGEVEPKGYVLASFEELDGELAADAPADGRRWRLGSWERIEVPATPMLLLEGELDGSSLAFGPPGARGASLAEGGLAMAGAGVAGAEVRLRYAVAGDQREAGRRAAAEVRNRLLEEGAVDVKLEEVVRPSARARAPEIARAVSLPDKLRAFWRARGTTPDAEREARLFSKLAQVESEVAHAA